MENIFKKEYLVLNSEAKNQNEAFNEMADLAVKYQIVDNKSELIKAFKNREAEASTGVEDGFAIPHARNKKINKTAVLFIKFKNGIEWNSIDGKKVKIAIALIVKEGKEASDHLKILSSIAMKLVDPKARDVLKTAKTYAVVKNTLFAVSKASINKDLVIEEKMENQNKKIIALTACPVGVAHTYMAAEKLEKKGQALGYDIKVETHGSSGVGNAVSEKEIAKADVIIIAADIGIDVARFAGKRVYYCRVSRAIKEPELVIANALKEAKIQVGKDSHSKDSKQRNKTGVMQHLMAGVSYMVPVIIVGGICLALSIGLTKIIYGVQWVPGTPGSPGDPVNHILSGTNFLSYLSGIGALAFMLMIPILAGFIANSIAGRAAIAPAMLGAMVGNTPSMFYQIGGLAVQTPTGFLGAIAVGLGVGYAVKWINTWPVPKNLQPIMPLFFIPIVLGVTSSILLIYVIGAPIGWLMEQFQIGITKILQEGNIGIGVSFGLGILIGAMSGFDLGGPVNKIAFLTCSALVTQKIYGPMGMMGVAGAVPPLGMASATLIFKRLFNEEERNAGISALIMGMIGISEGAIPFAINDPKRAIPCNMLGSAVAGGLGGIMMIQNYAAHTGPIVVILGAIPYGIQTLYAVIAILAGTAITCFSYGFWCLAAAKKGKKEIFHIESSKAIKKTLNKNQA